MGAPFRAHDTAALPVTATNKVLKRALRAERLDLRRPCALEARQGRGLPVAGDGRRRALEDAVGDRPI